MNDLDITEIKAFVPAKDYALSKQFYQDLGFELKSDGGGVAYFAKGNTSFLLQDFHQSGYTENFMLHILVQNVDDWFSHVQTAGLADKYGVRVTDIELQPWKMREFLVFDPSGVLLRIAQNV